MPDLISTGRIKQPTQYTPPQAKTDRIATMSSPAAATAPAQSPMTTVVTTSKGKQYTLDSNMTSWIQNRYKQSWAGSYGYDDADQQAYREGRMSAKVASSYKKNSVVDRQLAELGLPSEKNLEKYMKEYEEWHTGGIDQVFGNNVSPSAWTKMKDLYKQDWKYEDTADDQKRKAQGLMPSALEAKYTDTEIDDQLRAGGLPSLAEFDKYASKYNNYQGIDTLYRNAAGAYTATRLMQDVDGNYIQNDNKAYTVLDENTGLSQTMTGKQWYAKAFYDELGREDANGNKVYGSIIPLMKKSAYAATDDEYIDPTKNYVEEMDKLFAAYGKAESDADDFVNHQAFSYDDFVKNYDSYYEKYYKDFALSNGQTVNDVNELIKREQDAERTRQFYDVKDKWFDGDKGIDAFIQRYQKDYPPPTEGSTQEYYETMFSNMLDNGVSDSIVRKTRNSIRRASTTNSEYNAITDAYANVKAQRREKQEVDWDAINYDPNSTWAPAPEATAGTEKLAVGDYSKAMRDYVDQRMIEGGDEAAVNTAHDALSSAFSSIIDPDEGTFDADIDTVLSVINSIENAEWNNPIAMRLALADFGFGEDGTLSGQAANLTYGLSERDKQRLLSSIGAVRYNSRDISDDITKALEANPNYELGAADILRGGVALDHDRFTFALDWAKEQIANGRLSEGEAYNILAANGFQDEMEAYMPDQWHKAVFVESHVPLMFEQAGGDKLARWEEMTPEQQKAVGENMWNDLSEEQLNDMFNSKNWWQFDPTVYRTFGQALEQQFGAIIPGIAADLLSGGVKFADMITADITGRPEMWDVTKKFMNGQQIVSNYGSVYDNVNGAQIASVAADVTQEIAKMYMLGTIGGKIGEGTKLGQALARVAEGSNSNVIRKVTGLALDMLQASPFVVSATAHNYSEAKAMGATNGDATSYALITGMAEGVLEGMNFDHLWGKTLGQESVAKELMSGADWFNNAGVIAKTRLMSMVVSGLGEFTEESVGYALETYLKTKAIWGEGTEWSASDWIQQAGMGFLTGFFGGGLSTGAITEENVLTEYFAADPETRSAMIDNGLARVVFENAPETTKAMWRDGGAQVRSIDAYAQLVAQMKACEYDAKNVLDDIRSKEAKAQEKIDNAQAEVTKLEAKIAPFLGKTLTGEEAVEFAGLKVKYDAAVAHADDVRRTTTETLAFQAKEANTRLENAESQLQTLKNQFAEHYAGLYLMNESATAANDMQAVANNTANARQNGATVTPESRAERDKSAQPVDASQSAQYNNAITEEANADGRQGTEAGAGNEESQAGGNAGVSRPVGAVSNQSVQESGVLGRENPRWIESVPITDKLKEKGIDPVELRTDNNDPSSFHAAIGEAKASNPFGAFVTQHDVNEYGNMQTFLSEDSGVGVAVTSDGDIVSVFKNPTKNQSRRAASSILFTALENGGKTLDNFNSADLSDIYLQHGFVPVARIKFNDDYAPDGWNFERDGRPDILFWVHNGDDANTILDKMGTYEMPDVESLPLFEGENAYDEAKAYRDSLVNENTGWTRQTAQTEQAPVRRLSDEEVAKVQQTLKDLKFKNEVRFIDDPNEADGWIDDNGNITINRANISEAEAKELADNPGWWVLKHELAHFTEGTAEYDEYSGIVKRIIQRRIGDQGYISTINDIKSEYAQRGQTLDTPLAERELVAKFMQSGELLSNQESIEMFVREQGNLADRIYNWIRYKIDDLKLRRRPNSALARDMLKAERLYAQAYRKANRKPGRDNATQNDGFANGQNRTLSSGSSWDELLQKYGAQPQGRTPRASDERVPNRVDENTRVSRFGRSLYESPHMTDDMRAEARDMMVNQNWLSYTPTTNEESMNEARNFIAARQPLAAQQEFHDMVMQGKLGRKTNAIGLQLLADASARGDVDSFYAIATDLQIAATEAGQSAQIFNVLKELKGVGSAYYMQRVVDRLNAKYDDLIQKGKMQRITVSPVLMEQLSQARTVDQITEAEEAVAKEIAAQVPLTWADRLSSWRYFSMLGNPTTHIRNMTGNLLMKGLNATKDAVATGIESIGNIDQSQRAHAILTGADKSMWGDFAEASYNEQARNLSGGGKLGFETFVKQNTRSFDTRWLDALAKFNFNALEGEDIMFIRPAYKNALMQYMKAQGYTLNEKGQAGKVDSKGVFREMTNAQHTAAVEWASEQAWKQTFRDASSLATMLNKLSKEGPVAKLLIEGVMPFKKTPVNIAKRGLEYSPAGIIMGTVQLATKVRQGKMSAATAIDNLSSGITGTALMALGVFLAKAGLIRAGGEDKKKYETYLEDTGDQTYSFKFGNASINMSSIAPATIPLFMGVALQEMASRNDGDVDLSAITDMVAGTLNPFMEMSFMSSLNSALQNYSSNGIGGALGNTLLTAAQNYGSQYLPTLGGKVAQFVDPTRRTTKSDATSPIGGNLDYYARSLAKKVPGLESTLQADVDVWGRTDTKDSFGDWALDFFNKFILPTNIKVSNRDAVDRELIRVVESTGVVDFLPSDGNKYFTVKGERYNMNARQYKEFSQDRGQAAYAAIKDVMASPAYQAASDETRADMLKKSLDAAYKQVNNLWKEKLGAFGK